MTVDPHDVDAFRCDLIATWGVDPRLADIVAGAAAEISNSTGRTLRIISGFRTDETQRQLIADGRGAAPVGLSNHTVCPSRAVDVSIGAAPTNVQKALLGSIMVFAGLRWGGGSPVDPKTGIPSDWNHFDLGPRNA